MDGAYIDASTLTPIVTGITSTVTEFLPVLLGVFGLMFAVKLVPKLIAKFAK